MTIPEGGSCAMCKHRNLIALPRGTRPGGELPCSQMPLCGYELDASVVQGMQGTPPRAPTKMVTDWRKKKE